VVHATSAAVRRRGDLRRRRRRRGGDRGALRGQLGALRGHLGGPLGGIGMLAGGDREDVQADEQAHGDSCITPEMIELGKKAPAFALESSEGGKVKLADLAGKIVVLYFYPRDNTPGCTVEAQEFRDAVPALKKLGATVLGVSKDSIASHCKFRDKYGLSFPLLTDGDGKVMTAYGAWGDKVLYGKKMKGIIRSTVLIDQGGKIARHWPKVSVKGHVAEVVDAVKSIAK
jgi:peroxiredoxin Q/BCP